VSIRDRLPTPLPGEKLPANARSAPIVENSEAIAGEIARILRPSVEAGRTPGKFYYTGPVLKGLEDIGGLSPAESGRFISDWSGQGAATSPRTATPQNLRNASYLLWRREQGDPLTTAKREAEGNRPGFAMMGMHTDLADQFANNNVNLWRNPKPGTFQQNWAGNTSDVTGDTHNIRGTLSILDALHPGSVPRGWFNNDEAYKLYRERGGFAPGVLPVGDINDSLQGVTVKKVPRQTEYGVMTDPWYRAADKLNIPPAEAQAHGWFDLGERTGLRSPELTIPDLLNSQIEETARATGAHPDDILRLWARRKIPLAEAEPGMRFGSSAVG